MDQARRSKSLGRATIVASLHRIWCTSGIASRHFSRDRRLVASGTSIAVAWSGLDANSQTRGSSGSDFTWLRPRV